MKRLFPPFLVVALVGAVIVIALVVGMPNAWAAPTLSTGHQMVKPGSTLADEGFISFVVSRDTDKKFIVSGEKIGGTTVSVSILVMDPMFSGQIRSDARVEVAEAVTSIGATGCRTESSLSGEQPCGQISFADGEAGRFELSFTPADWLIDPIYTVSVDETVTGNSMNIHEPKEAGKTL